MTNSLFELFQSPNTAPRDDVIVNGRYSLPPIGDPTGKRRSLQRVTNFVKQISDTEALTKWKMRMLVIGMASDERLYDLATSLDRSMWRDLEDVAEKAIDLGQAGPSGGNITGTALHNYTDNVGHTPIRVREKWAPKVENYQRALHEQGLRPVAGLSERLVVSERFGVAGRLDDVYEDPFGVLRVGDRKSQKKFYTWFEIGAQLACYQIADAMWNEQECRFEEMPKLADDYGIVAWMPLTYPGGRPDEVELFRVPLEPARELLKVLELVRGLRTGATRWGQQMPALNAFERTARDIRDAETHDDLRKIAAARTAENWTGEHTEMAAARWEEIALEQVERAQSSPIVPVVPVADPAQDWARLAQIARVDQLPSTEVTFQGLTAVSDICLNGTVPDNEVWAVGDVKAGEPLRLLTDVVTVPREMIERSPVDLLQLFQSPSDALFEDATFPDEGDRVRADDSGATVPAPVLTKLDPRIVDGVTQRPSTEAEREAYEAGRAVRLQAHPVATAPHTNSLNHGATVVELPADAPTSLPTSQTDLEAAIEALSTVPLKIVREVAGRAANSSSSRGRVRLLNDVEEKKYAAHGVELMPALLREWLELDGLNGEPGFNKDGVPRVANTGGARREPMDVRLAGKISLTSYLKTLGEEVPERTSKKGSATPAQGETDAFGQPVAVADQVDDAVTAEQAQTYGMTTFGPIVKGSDGLLYVQAEKGDHDISGEVRPEYDRVESYAVRDLIMLAKDARNAHERGIAILEIARREEMTKPIADELDQHYRTHGYAGNLPAPANNTPGKRPQYTPDYLREATINELRDLALNVGTPGERGQILHELGRRDAWGRMPVTQIDVAWRNENLPGVPSLAAEWNSIKYVTSRIEEVADVAGVHALWAELMHLPVFHRPEVQAALNARVNGSR